MVVNLTKVGCTNICFRCYFDRFSACIRRPEHGWKVHDCCVRMVSAIMNHHFLLRQACVNALACSRFARCFLED